MRTYTPDEYLMISGIQHFAFCRRQWALIHIENLWDENRLTAEGRAIHKRAHDDGFKEKRKDLLVTRGLRVSSRTLGMSGTCDVVEFVHADDGVKLNGHRGLWRAAPVEYKHGKDKRDDSDVLQLCCQVICLEEMLCIDIPYGYLYYHALRKRRRIEIDDDIRKEAYSISSAMHDYASRGYTPSAKLSAKCRSCSLKDMCLPKIIARKSVSEYMKKYLESGDE